MFDIIREVDMPKKKIPEEFRKTTLTCYLSPSEIRGIDKIAKETDRARIYVIEQAVIEYLNNHSKEENNKK